MLNNIITIKVNSCVRRKLVLICLFVVHRTSCSIPVPTFDDWKCVPVELDICKGVRYNETINMGFNLPNKLTQKRSQDESKADLDLFLPLLKARRKCSANLRLLLCSVYIPFCSPKVKRPITSCRPLCERVKSQCNHAMNERGMEWPDALNCERLPAKNDVDNKMCLDGGIGVDQPRKQTKKPRIPDRDTHRVKNPAQTDVTKITSSETFCNILYRRNNRNYFFVEKLQACALQCLKDGLFTFNEKQLVEKWLSALACVCGLLCVFSLAVVVFEYQNTCYPERTIVFITACYLFYSLAYIIRIIYSREGVSCREEEDGLRRRYLLIDGSGNLSCASIFLLTYCFSLAQNIWWIMLSFSWFLSAGLKWRPDLIRALSMYFHIFSWGVPCAMTVIVLVIRKIDVNELTGICYIGNRYENLPALRAFVLGPLFTFLTMGIMFLLFGFVAIFRISSNKYGDNRAPSSKLERPLLSVGIYAALHAFFSIFIFSSYFYEYANKTKWYRDPDSGGPIFEVFLIRIIMDFLIGISGAVWLLVLYLPSCLKRKLYSKSSGITDITREHTVLTAIKPTRENYHHPGIPITSEHTALNAMKSRGQFNGITNLSTENPTLSSLKTRVDTSETSI